MRVYVDIDDTLVSTRYRELEPEVAIRPSAVPFLEELSASRVELYAHSYGDRERQVDVLRGVGLLDYFVEVIGRDDTPDRPPGPWVLVDNEDPIFEGLRHKIRQLGHEPDDALWELHFVQCVDWLGEGDEEPLTALVPQVLHGLRRQA